MYIGGIFAENFYESRFKQMSIELSILTTNETCISQNVFFLLFFSSQISKSVNDDTKYKVENNNDENEEKEHVVNDPW